MDILGSISTVQNPATFISYSGSQVAFNLFFAFILSTLVALVYQFTHRGYSYSKNFVSSLIIISLVVTVVMMVIGNSLARAFALLGAFSIIRFRTAVKDTKDIAFIFMSLVLGMAAGTNNYIIGLVGTISILAIVLLLDRINLAGAEKTQYTLSIFAKNDKQSFSSNKRGFSSNKIDWRTFDKYIKSRNLISTSTRDNGKLTEHVFAVDFKKGINLDEFIREVSQVKSIERVHLFSTKEEIEY